MTFKKSIKYFLLISFSCILFFPILNISINLYENKKSLLELSKKELFSTDKVVSYINFIAYDKFDISLNKKRVVLGKEDFFFLGNKYKNVIKKSTGEFRPSKDELNKWVLKIKKLQTWYEDKDIKFVFVIAPNKHTIYKEKLPFTYANRTMTDDIVSNLKANNINMIDLRDVLLENKITDDLLYYRRDTHWNQKGAALAYEKTIDYINDKFLLNIKKPKYDFELKYKTGGDLTNILKITEFFDSHPEKSHEFYFEDNNKICKGNIDIHSGKLEKCIEEDNPFININLKPKYTINKFVNNSKLLWLCDSFAISQSKIYNKSFNTIWKWHYNHLHGNKLKTFVDANKPQVVIYQVVERNLYDGIKIKL